MDSAQRSRNTLTVWAALQFPRVFCAAWQQLAPGQTSFDWSGAVSGRHYRVFWRGGSSYSGYKYFFLTLPFYKTEEAARAAAPVYTFAAGAGQVKLNSGCWLDLEPGYKALNLYYHYALTPGERPNPERNGESWFGISQWWKAGDTIQLWVDETGIRCAVTYSGKNSRGTARSVVQVCVENKYVHYEPIFDKINP